MCVSGSSSDERTREPANVSHDHASQSRDLRGHGHPFVIETFAANAGISHEQAEADVNSAVPFRERGEPQDIANMIAFLASDEASYVTGASFRVDGG